MLAEVSVSVSVHGGAGMSGMHWETSRGLLSSWSRTKTPIVDYRALYT